MFSTRPSEMCDLDRVCHLSALADNQAGVILEGSLSGDQSGYSVSGVGDVNGDGLNDFIVGAYGASKSYLVTGSRTETAWGRGVLSLSDIATAVFEVEAVDSAVGYSVAGVGDVNGDGVDDLILGAQQDSSPSKRSYVIFGSTVMNSRVGVLSLHLVPETIPGLVLEGESSGDYSVSGVGDVNGDGVGDFIVGVYSESPGGRYSAGKSYVVFGSVNRMAWGNGILSLANVGGVIPGLVLEGELAGDGSGYSVSGVGDVNGDGVDDFIVGAPYAARGGRYDVGKSYVLFGSLNGTAWGNGTLSLADVGKLIPGIMLEGDLAGDRSGLSVSGVGDVNQDGVDDLIVGAPQCNCYDDTYCRVSGKAYVMFGSLNEMVWGTGNLSLADVGVLVPGLVLEGELAGDRSGCSVSGGGDVNGDGVDDLIVGAWGADPKWWSMLIPSYTGKSYVIFGSVNGTAWRNGTLSLANVGSVLPGLVLEGETQSDWSGSSVAGLGDVNGDGVDDLIVGAYGADPGGRSQTGKSYVLFGGDETIEILVNQLRIESGQKIILNATHLIATSRFTNNTNLPFSVLDMLYGHFERISAADRPISQFNQGEVISGNIRFVHQGANIAPIYTICIYPGRFYGVCSTPDITFLGFPPALQTNTLSVNQGIPVVLNNRDLSATDADNTLGSLNYQITQIAFGHFKRLNSLGQVINSSITTFTQQDVLDQRICFVQDGSTNMPAYQVSVGDEYSFTVPQSAFIRFNRLPVMTLSNFVIDQGTGTLITHEMLSATDLEMLDINLAFQVSNVTQGQFEYVNNPGSGLVAFPQFAIMQGTIHFVHSGSNELPTFAFSVNDGSVSINPRMVNITLNHRPTLIGKLADQNKPRRVHFDIKINQDVFRDLDNEDLNLSASLLGGVPLPTGIHFDSLTRTLSGTVAEKSTKTIEIKASDSRKLFAVDKFELEIGLSDFDQLRALWESASIFLSVILGVGGFLLLRKKTLDHRKGHQFANLLRKRLKLGYYDFDRFQGDVYKSKINQLLGYIDAKYEGFYSRLAKIEKQPFVDCVARVMEHKEGLIKGAGFFTTAINILWFLRCWRTRELDFDQLADLIPEIAEEAVSNWRRNETPWNVSWNRLDCDERLFSGFCCAKKPVKSDELAESIRSPVVLQMTENHAKEKEDEEEAANGISCHDAVHEERQSSERKGTRSKSK